MKIELEDLKGALGVTTDDDDVLLTDIISRIGKQVESYCNREFDSEERTEYYNGDGTNKLRVNHYPITAIDSIYDDTDREYGLDVGTGK